MHSERDPKPHAITFEEVTRVAKEMLLQHGNHVPTLIVEGSKETVVTQVLDVADTNEGRVQQMFEVGYSLARSGEVGTLRQVYFVIETWMSTVDPGEQPAIRPSQDPQRKEILLITSVSVPQREQKAAVLEMVRDQTGHLTELRDLPFDDEGVGENRLLTAFVVGFTVASSAKFN
jgi:hypothetical protein